MSIKALREEFVRMGLKLAQATGWAVLRNVGSAVYDIIWELTGSSLGLLIAKAIDKIDGKKGGYIFA